MSVSLIVPAYNEEKRIEPFLVQLSLFIQKAVHKYEVVLVDDGSTDATLSILKTFKGERHAITIISYDQNRGKGFALREGIMNSKGDYIISLDADNSFNLDDVNTLVDALKTSDVAIGNKYMKRQAKDTRFFIGSCFNLLVNTVFHLKVYDCFSGLKGYRKACAQELFKQLHYERWLLDVEVLVKAKNRGYRISDTPVDVTKVKGSKFRLRDHIKLFFQILKMKYVDRAEKW